MPFGESQAGNASTTKARQPGLFYAHWLSPESAQKAGEAMNDLSPGALLADERSIQVVLDRMLDGYSVMISMAQCENNSPWHKAAVVCR